MDLYLGIKLVHIVSATLLFGTGLGTAFFMLQAYRSGSDGVMRASTNAARLCEYGSRSVCRPSRPSWCCSGSWFTNPGSVGCFSRSNKKVMKNKKLYMR